MNDLLKNEAFGSSGGRLFLGGLIAASCFLPFTSPGQAVQQQALRNHVPPAIARLGLRPVGQLAGTTRLNLSIGLPLRNRDALTGLLHDLYDPGSTNYHRFLTPQQFTEKFGPTDEDYQAVIGFAQAHGFTVTQTHPNRVLVDVSGNVADIEKTFRVKLGLYRHPAENRTFFAPDLDPSVPAGLPVLDVSGLNDYSVPRPQFVRMPINNATNGSPNLGTGPGGTYMGSDFRNAYAPGVTMDGTGQAIGLLEFDSYFPGDISRYENQAGLPNVPLQQVNVTGAVVSPGSANVEVALDIEVAIAMAPGLSKIIIYQAPRDGVNWVPLLSRIANDNQVRQISCSWGGGIGNPSAAADQIFLQMASQGQSFFTASGDADAFTGNIPFPSDNPNITVVGGTTLTSATNGASLTYISETVWNWGIVPPFEDGIGSSGGISLFYSIPSWQIGVNVTNVGGSALSRNFPDVALTADNILVYADNDPTAQSVGGTSAAAPLWAAFTALANQQADFLGNPQIGFVNPTIYAIAKTNTYAADFHDVRTGNNTWSGSPTRFFAANGFDLCTGWGSPNGQNLIDGLAGPRLRLGLLQATVSPPPGSALISSTSQPFFVTVNDFFGVSNATVTATTAGVASLNVSFLNNAVSPDTATDNVYSASVAIPNVQGTLTMTVVATNVGEVSITNTYSYTVISTPGNDNFANPIKVPAAGATYLSNNRFATMEVGEVKHDNISTVTNSLWWSYTPTSSTNVFVDTTGSATNAIVAVYTGTTLFNLVRVTSTNRTFVSFNAAAGTTYYIAVASRTAALAGPIRLRVAPGGQPDTTPPTVQIVSPLSGLWVSNKLVSVTGTANDLVSNGTGLTKVILRVNNRNSFIADGTASWTCPLVLKPGLNTILATAFDNAGNVSAPASLQLSYFQPSPANDAFAGAIALTNNAGSVTGANTNATKEFGEPNHGGNPGGKSVWWSFAAPADGVLTLNCAGSSFDTLLGLYTGSSVSSLTAIAENDDAYSGAPGGFSQITQAVKAGLTYSIAVDGYGGAAGNISLSYTFAPATVFHLTTAATTGGNVEVTSSNALGGLNAMVGTAGDFASGSTVILTAVPNSGYQFTAWSGANTSTNNPLLLVMAGDTSITGQFSLFGFDDGFESGDFSQLNWTTAGVPWFVQSAVVSSGQYAARSGVIGNSQTSSLIMVTNNFMAGIGTFDFRVSSETNFDYLSFYMDGVLLARWSGEVGWSTFTFPVTAGAHGMEWRYSKDASLSSGLDAAFVDNAGLQIDPPAVVVPLPASLSLQRLGGGTFAVNVVGQTNQQYILQVSVDLINWQNISTNTAVNGTVQITDPASVSNSTRFYRAITVP